MGWPKIRDVMIWGKALYGDVEQEDRNRHKKIWLPCVCGMDEFIQDLKIVERMSVKEIKSLHEAQLLACVQLAGMKIG